MKKLILIMLTLFSIFSCNDDFMERYPKTEITKENFFNTAEDLNTYINGLYGNISSSYDDIGSDNIAQREAKDDTWELIHGAVTEDNVGGWSWGSLRSINFFLENYKKSTATEVEKSHYVGIARFFRAQFYIGKVKKFSDVPWISKPLATSDVEKLFKTQDSRGMVVDSIIADLQYASENISLNDSDKSQISKYAALASLARFALYEGAFRKYGAKNTAEATYLAQQKASDYNALLQIAKNASQQIMDEGGFALSDDYEALFNSLNLSSNQEIILFEDYEKNKRMSGSYTRLDWQYCLSQNLVDEYLKLDGSALTRQELDTLQYRHSFTGRDERLKTTVSYPGYAIPGSGPHVAKILFGGLGQIKFTPKEADAWSWGKSYNDLLIFRYAEVLLINAESHAELGSLTNAVLNNTVNLLRKRAGIIGGDVTMGSAVDPILDARYQGIDATPKGAALEIRRERRVELACEGLRFDDLMRWHLGDAIFTVNGKPENLQRGMYVPKMTLTGGAKFTLLEVTGDAIADIIIAETAEDLVKAETYYNGLSTADAEFYKKLNKVSLEETIALKNGDEGHIIWNRELDSPGTFLEPKYYYRPIPLAQILVNDNLKQHEFWK